MGLRYQYVSIDTIFSKLIRDYGDNFNEGDVIEWTAEALEAIGAVRSYQEAVAFIEVKNHTCEMPKGIHNIIQIARDNDFRAPVCPDEVVQSCTSPFRTQADDCDNCPPVDADGNPIPDFLVLDSKGQPLNDYDVAYYRPYFDLIGEFYLWSNCNLYKKRFTPIHLSTHSYASAMGLVCTDGRKGRDLYQSSNDEYTIVLKKTLRFSFRDGHIALAYNRQVLDPTTNYPMIPDHYSYKTAITKYIRMMIQGKLCDAGREGACGRASKLEQDWQWYCSQAKAMEIIPNGEDEHQNLTNQMNYLLPRDNRYFGFFGNLNQPERRIWNNPNGR